MDALTVVLVALAMAVGVAGTVVPLVPGLGLVAAAGLVFGLVEGFGAVGWAAFVGIVVIGIAGGVAGIVLPHRAAGGAGAPRQSLLLGAAGAVVGFFAVPVIGFVLGGLVGIYVGERSRTGDGALAWRTTKATLRGFGVGAIVQFVAGLAMVGVWILWVVAA